MLKKLIISANIAITMLFLRCSNNGHTTAVVHQNTDTLFVATDSSQIGVKVPTRDCGKVTQMNIDKKRFKEIATIVHEDYSLQVTTIFQRDSILEEEPRLFRPVPISQKLTFRHKDKILHEYPSPALKVKQRIYGGGKIEMLDNLIFSVRIASNDTASMFRIGGYGGCNGDCTELDLAYSIDGKLLFLDYHVNMGKVIKRYGDEAQVAKQYGMERLRSEGYTKCLFTFGGD